MKARAVRPLPVPRAVRPVAAAPGPAAVAAVAVGAVRVVAGGRTVARGVVLAARVAEVVVAVVDAGPVVGRAAVHRGGRARARARCVGQAAADADLVAVREGAVEVAGRGARAIGAMVIAGAGSGVAVMDAVGIGVGRIVARGRGGTRAIAGMDRGRARDLVRMPGLVRVAGPVVARAGVPGRGRLRVVRPRAAGDARGRWGVGGALVDGCGGAGVMG